MRHGARLFTAGGGWCVRVRTVGTAQGLRAGARWRWRAAGLPSQLLHRWPGPPGEFGGMGPGGAARLGYAQAAWRRTADPSGASACARQSVAGTTALPSSGKAVGGGPVRWRSMRSSTQVGADHRPMSPSRPFILRPVATSLFMLAIVLAGLVGFRFLPLSALPQVDFPTIQVQTLYPGGSPGEPGCHRPARTAIWPDGRTQANEFDKRCRCR